MKILQLPHFPSNPVDLIKLNQPTQVLFSASPGSNTCTFVIGIKDSNGPQNIFRINVFYSIISLYCI